MVQPGSLPAAISPFAAAPPPAAAQTPQMGQLFTVALLQAGLNGCTCKSCAYLVKIRTVMLETAEGALDVGKGDNPQP
jgi:hypothetical protein